MKTGHWMKTGALLACMMCIVSCATWTHLDDPRMSGPDGQYAVTAPACWIHAAFIKDRICISKDGPYLNWIEISHHPREQGFPLTQVKLQGDLLVTEIANYFLAELKEQYNGGTVRHLSTEPAEIDGREGFKIHLTVTGTNGLEIEVAAYGVMDTRNFYYMLYKAPRLHYFRKELNAFEELVATFHTGRKE